MKLPKIFSNMFKKKDKLSELELKLKKYPKKRRAKLIRLYEQYNRGQVLKPNEDLDNKQMILSKNG
jgi:hypothetical protein